MAAADCVQLEMAHASTESVAESQWDEAGALAVAEAWQWCAAWQSTSFEPCDVMIENLPIAIANDDDCIEAMLQQAGLIQSLIAFERQGKKSGKVLVSLENRMAAEFCIMHFRSCQWIRHQNAKAVKAYIMEDDAASDDQIVASEPKDGIVTKYLPMKLQGQRVLHQISPGTYRVEIPRPFWHLVGIAYRKSMNLNDRDDCGIDHGQIVHGKQVNGWLAVEFKKSDCEAEDTKTIEPETALKATASLQSRGSTHGKRSNWKQAAADDSGTSTTLSQASVVEDEVSDSEISNPPKSDSHAAETACPSDDDSEHSSQVQSSQKHVKLVWADVETDDENDLEA